MDDKTKDKSFFSGIEEDFACFSEQFEAQTYVLKLNKFLDGSVGYNEFIPTLKGQPSQEQINPADQKTSEFL